MKMMDKVLKKLSDLYEFNRKLQAYDLKKKTDKSLKGDAAKNNRAS